MDLLNMLTGLFTSSSSVDALSTKSGTDSSQTKSILGTALPMLLSALTSNASSESGATSLLGALSQHTSTASMADQIANADAEDGSKIIAHILGDKKSSVVEEISKKTGADSKQVSALLSNIAPGMLSGISAVTAAQQKTAAKVATQAKVATVAKVGAQAKKLDVSNLTAKKEDAKKVETKIEVKKVEVKKTETKAEEAKAEEAKAEPAGLDLSGLLGLLGGGEVSSDNSTGGMLSGLLGGLFGGGSDSDSGSDSDGGLFGALKNILK